MAHQVTSTRVVDKYTGLSFSGGTQNRDLLGNTTTGAGFGDYQPVVGYDANGGTCGLRDATALSNNYNAVNTPTVTFPNADYPSGSTITGKTIWGDITIATGTITFDNCVLKGGNFSPLNASNPSASNSAVIRADNNRAGTTSIVTIKDCEIDPVLPSLNRDGFRGNRMRIFRTYIHDTIDGGTFYAGDNVAGGISVQNGGNANSWMMGCVLENLRYGYPDYENGTSGATEHGDGTHNDLLAIQGGENIWIKGNYFIGSGTELPGNTHPLLTEPTWVMAGGWNYGACIIVNEDAGSQVTNTTVIEKNWFTGGKTHLNVKPNTSFVFQNNRHYRNVAQNGQPLYQGFWIRLDDHTPVVTGMEGTNVWVDGPFAGDFLTATGDTSTWNTNGIHYNA